VRDSVRDVDRAPKLGDAEVGRIFRQESGRSVAALIRVFGDVDVAEDAVQEAFAVALRKWSGAAPPRRPAGYLAGDEFRSRSSPRGARRRATA
jgi:RNA polymerase sigma-70 factor (ECF subfamily)